MVKRGALFLVLVGLAAMACGIDIGYFLPVPRVGFEQSLSTIEKNISFNAYCNMENGNTGIGCSRILNQPRVLITSPQNNSQVTAGDLIVSGTVSGNTSSLENREVALKMDGVHMSYAPIQHTSSVNPDPWQVQFTIPPGRHSLTAIISNADRLGSFSITINATSTSTRVWKTGIYVPMYSVSTLGSYLKVIRENPGIPYAVSINPNSGPGTSVDSRFTNAITTLHTSGLNVTVIGYVPTGYGSGQTIASVEGMIDTWYSLYPNIDGIMFDEVSSSSSTDSFYQTVTDYARTVHGAHFLRGNPGAPIDVGKVGMFNTIDVGESGTYPSMSLLQSDTFNGAYGKAKFGFIVHDQPTLDTTWLIGAEQYLGYVYITNGVEPNPYAQVPSYFAQEVSTLQAQ